MERKSIQLSSFDSNALYDGNSEFSEIWNISCIKNSNQNNNYDLHSLFSNIPGEKKYSGIDTLSFLEKKENNISRRQTEKQINIFKGHRNSIGPTFNIIVNNNNNSNSNNNNETNNNRKISMRSLKNSRYNSIMFGGKNTTPSPNKMNFNKNKKNNKSSSFNINRASNLYKRSNSSTMSGLYLNQFYSLINNNPRYFKSKYQIIKEIQNKIKQTYKKKSNSLIIEKTEKTEKNESNNIKIESQPLLEEESPENKKDILQEYYEDKSSANIILQSNNNSIFNKLNEKK